jgi:hypothetical protein
MKERESEVERHLVWHVARMGGKTYKFASPAHRGVADRIVCLPNGMTWFIELKALTGKLAPLQERFATEMEDLNQLYVCLWSLKQVDEWVESLGLEWLH